MDDGFKLIVFTVPDFFPDEEKIISELFANDLEILHLRKPNFSVDDLRTVIEKIPHEFHSRIVIHNHFELLEEFDLKGIHLTEKQKNNFQTLSQKHKIISTSCHSIDEIKQQKSRYEYVFLSPIFDSISKQNYNSKFSTVELLAAKSQKIIDKKVIALGGIDLNNIKTVLDFGFGGVGILGTLWNSFNYSDTILKQFLLLQNKINL
jgi:thiamine-phosphate pyrophosphorylase